MPWITRSSGLSVSLKTALREDDGVGRRPRAQAELQAARHHGLRSGRGAGLHHILIQQILKLSAARLEAGGVGVGQIVGDVVDAHLLGGHAAGGAV